MLEPAWAREELERRIRQMGEVYGISFLAEGTADMDIVKYDLI